MTAFVSHAGNIRNGVKYYLDNDITAGKYTLPQSVCDMLGYDPMYLACEGRVVAVVDAREAPALLQVWQSLEEGREAAIIGRIDSAIPYVLMQTEIGGERILEELGDDTLPRIC